MHLRKNKTIRNLWYRLSANQRFFVRRAYYFPTDFYDTLAGKRHKYVPPRGYIYTGSPASAKVYLEQGQEQLELLESNVQLQPADAVLDIGSGVGRTAIALTSFLDKEATYDGFDVVKKGVDWCNKKIKRDYPNFNFKYIPLFNDLYNNEVLNANEFTFPYGDHSFDKIFSFSVFTHMQIDEIQHYFHEIKRVLQPEGMGLSTFFIYDQESENHIANREGFAFPHAGDGFRLMNEDVKSGNIAVHREKLEQMLEASGLQLVSLIEGFWKEGKKDEETREYQDLVIFKQGLGV